MKDELELVFPSEEYKEKILDFKNEFIKNGEMIIHGGGGLDKEDNFEVWLKNIKEDLTREIPTKEGKIVPFDMPNIDKYKDKEGNMKYIKSVSLNSKKDNLIPEIRKALLEALISNETNEYGKTVIEHKTNIDYDKDYVKSYIRPLSFENNPYIKATGRVLVGGVLALNNVRLNEGISKEGNEFQSISVPEKKIEQEYKPLIYLDKDLREKIKDNLVSEYNKETKEQEENNEETEEDEI